MQNRMIAGEPNPNGTANLYATQMPADRTNAILDRIDRLARGLPDDRSPDQKRADVFSDLLEGNGVHADPTTGP